MKYTKPPLNFEEQADLLLSRGMEGDRVTMIDRLMAVSYYRLSGYWFPFRLPDNTYKPNTRFDVIWERYVFDRQLRLIVIDAVERIEVAIRTQLVYLLAYRTGNPFSYALDPKVLPNLATEERERFLADLKEEVDHSRETFAGHFRKKYSMDHPYMPIWMACELMTFGEMLKLYRGCDSAFRKEIAAKYAVHDTVLESWLLALNTIRNICAHHARLWNREMGIRPKIPLKSPLWHDPVEVTGDRVFGILTVCKYCLDKIAPQSHWPSRFRDLLQRFPYVPRGSMGIPTNWEECPIWKEAGNGK